MYRTGGWPASVEGDALTDPYSAPSAGPTPWHLYRLTLHPGVGVPGAGVEVDCVQAVVGIRRTASVTIY